MKFGISLTDAFENKYTLILSGKIQIWHFYRTLYRGSHFSRTQCSNLAANRLPVTF